MATQAYTNGYNPFQFTDLSGGLNLRDKSDAVGEKEAVDLLNVTFTERGAVRQRDGTADLTVELANRVDSLHSFYTVAGQRQLIAGCGNRLEAISHTGEPIAAVGPTGGGPYNFARFADPLHEYIYAANGINQLYRWDGATWTPGTFMAKVNGTADQAMPRAGAICVTSAVPGTTSGTNAANRLVATSFGTQTDAGPGGQPSNPSRVYFSNPGQPEIWETDGYVGDVANNIPGRGRNFTDLTPGDGERITAAVTWRELVFIFKETKFFVLWGESTGTDGNPVFQIRQVANMVGASAPYAVAVGRDGVYFMNRRGVYHTTGSDPVMLSDIITPLWTGDPDPYYQGLPINLSALAAARAVWHMEQLFVAVPTGTSQANDRILVYDTQHRWWSIHDIPASALASFRRADRGELHFGYAVGPQRIGYRAHGLTTDRGQRIQSRWRSGWSDYGSSQQKTLRETKVWGTGAIGISFAVDFDRQRTPDIDLLFGKLGPWPASSWVYRDLTARGGTYALLAPKYDSYATLKSDDPVLGGGTDFITWNEWLAQYDNRWPVTQVGNLLVRRATRGTLFSTQFENTELASSWSVHRVARHMREVREPSIR